MCSFAAQAVDRGQAFGKCVMGVLQQRQCHNRQHGAHEAGQLYKAHRRPPKAPNMLYVHCMRVLPKVSPECLCFWRWVAGLSPAPGTPEEALKEFGLALESGLTSCGCIWIHCCDVSCQICQLVGQCGAGGAGSVLRPSSLRR